MRTTFRVTVYKKDGRVWTTFTKDDYADVVRLTNDWSRQPGCGRIKVVGRLGTATETLTDWRAE